MVGLIPTGALARVEDTPYWRRRIADGDVPEGLKTKRLIALTDASKSVAAFEVSHDGKRFTTMKYSNAKLLESALPAAERTASLSERAAAMSASSASVPP